MFSNHAVRPIRKNNQSITAILRKSETFCNPKAPGIIAKIERFTLNGYISTCRQRNRLGHFRSRLHTEASTMRLIAYLCQFLPLRCLPIERGDAHT